MIPRRKLLKGRQPTPKTTHPPENSLHTLFLPVFCLFVKGRRGALCTRCSEIICANCALSESVNCRFSKSRFSAELEKLEKCSRWGQRRKINPKSLGPAFSLCRHAGIDAVGSSEKGWIPQGVLPQQYTKNVLRLSLGDN